MIKCCVQFNVWSSICHDFHNFIQIDYGHTVVNEVAFEEFISYENNFDDLPGLQILCGRAYFHSKRT